MEILDNTRNRVFIEVHWELMQTGVAVGRGRVLESTRGRVNKQRVGT